MLGNLIQNRAQGTVLTGWEGTSLVSFAFVSLKPNRMVNIPALRAPDEDSALALLDEAEALGKEHDIPALSFTIPETNALFGPLGALLPGRGFVVTQRCHLYYCHVRDEEFPEWNAYMELRAGNLMRHFSQPPYRTLSFAQADEELLSRLKNSRLPPFENPLSLDYLLDGKVPFLQSSSFITVKDTEPIAYCAVSGVGTQGVVVEGLSTAKRFRGSGCALLPCVKSMRALFEHGYRRASYMMDDANSRVLALKDDFFSHFTKGAFAQVKYVKRIHA
jgi:hypothetical protein